MYINSPNIHITHTHTYLQIYIVSKLGSENTLNMNEKTSPSYKLLKGNVVLSLLSTYRKTSKY